MSQRHICKADTNARSITTAGHIEFASIFAEDCDNILYDVTIPSSQQAALADEALSPGSFSALQEAME